MNPKQRLRSAKEAAANGRYEEALREYIWFHEHAIEQEPALYGVRLSFALGDWIDLAKVYPNARRALEEIRDRNIASVLRGEGGRETFHDVASINEHLKCEHSTADLFARMVSDFPGVGESVRQPGVARAGQGWRL